MTLFYDLEQLAILSPERKTPVETETLKKLVISNEISFFNSFDIFDIFFKIKSMISSELVIFRKEKIPLVRWRNSSNDLFENLIFTLVFFCYCTEVITKVLGNCLRVCDCFIVL